MMSFYLLDDDATIRNILKLIITDRELGTICGSVDNGYDALDDLPHVKPDIVIVDLLMPEMDGITFVEEAKKILPEVIFVMLSQVSSKDMISSAYAAGVEFFIQKPINSVEVETVLRKVSEALSMKRTMTKMQTIFMEEMKESAEKKSSMSSTEQENEKLRTILTKLGIIGDTGSKDIISVVNYLNTHPESADQRTVSELCSNFCDNPKSMEQRIRRAAANGLTNLAHIGLDDYANEVFIDYSSSIYNYEQVRREMDYIRGKSPKHGNVRIRNFLGALSVSSQR